MAIKVTEYDKFEDEIRKLYCDDNLSYEDISNILNIPIKDLRNLMRRKGIKLSKDKLVERRKQSFINKYGVSNPFASDIVKDKIANTNLSKYGCRVPTQSKEIQDKIKKTNLERYGVECVLQATNISKKKYNIDCFSKKDIPESSLEILDDYDKFKDYILSIPFENRKYNIISDMLMVSYTTVGRRCDQYNLTDYMNIGDTHSIGENNVKDLVNSLGISTISTRNIIKPYEIDIYIPDYNLGIEFNGTYWHSSDKKSPDYHQIKSLMARDKNIFIYHIFEYEWDNSRKREIIKSQLCNLFHKNNRKIYARNCDIRLVSSKDSRYFLDNNHIQGNRNSSIKLGLYYNDELVSLMTFGKDKFIDKSDNWQLLRFCSKLNTTVVGGASKLFKYFIRNYNPDKIISYCDIAKGRGVTYEKLGFKLDRITPCNYVWVSSDGLDIKSRYQCQKRLIKGSDNDTRTEYEIMSDRGYFQIFDCGSYKYVWYKNN